MRLQFALALACLSAATPAYADAKKKPPAKAPPEPSEPSPNVPNPNDCAQAEATASYVGFGYTHTITLRNACPRAVTCTVWTDVDPEPKNTVEARPGESVSVVTRRGSPASAVTAAKNCSFR